MNRLILQSFYASETTVPQQGRKNYMTLLETYIFPAFIEISFYLVFFFLKDMLQYTIQSSFNPNFYIIIRKYVQELYNLHA